MWGVLLVPSSSPTLSPTYDGLDVNVTSNVTWFHLNHDMVPRQIYELPFYGWHSITRGPQMKTSEKNNGAPVPWHASPHNENGDFEKIPHVGEMIGPRLII